MLKKLLLGTAALTMVAAPMAASAEPWGHERWDHDRGRDAGAAVAAGVIGLALGAAIASNHHDNRYRSYDYDDYNGGYYNGGYYNGGYYNGGGDYGGDYYGSYGYAPVRCHWETRAYPGPWGGVRYQNVRVCYRY